MKKLKEFYRKYKTECNIYAAALIVQLVMFAFLVKEFGSEPGAFQFYTPLDADEYIKLGMNLFYHHVFSVVQSGSVFLPESVRPPLYPAFIAFFYAIYNKLWFVVLIQNLLMAIVPVMVYRVGFLLWNSRKIAFLAAILYLFEIERAVMSSQFLSDTLFTLLLILSFYFYIKTERNINAKKYIFITAILVALATLTRPVGIIVLAGYIAFMILRGFYDKLWKKRFALAAILFLTSFAILFPWAERNYIIFGNFKLSSSGNYTLYLENIVMYYNHKLGGGGLSGKKFDIGGELLEKFKKDNNIPENTPKVLLVRGVMRDFKYDKYYLDEFLKVVKSDPVGYCKLHFFRFLPFFTDNSYSTLLINAPFYLPRSWSYPYIYFAGRLPWLIMELVIIAGVFMQILKNGWRKFEWEKIMIILGMLAFAGTSAMITASFRLRWPINPFIFLLFSYYVFWFWDYFKDKKIKQV